MFKFCQHPLCLSTSKYTRGSTSLYPELFHGKTWSHCLEMGEPEIVLAQVLVK